VQAAIRNVKSFKNTFLKASRKGMMPKIFQANCTLLITKTLLVGMAQDEDIWRKAKEMEKSSNGKYTFSQVGCRFVAEM
jgi:hypothetical protein